MLPRRLAVLPIRSLPGGLVVAEARSIRSRLLGLAFVAGLPPGHALLIAPCRSVHTAGMRFPLDLIFLDRAGEVVRVVRALGPRRLAGCRRARAVLECRAGEADRFLGAAPLLR